MGTSIPLSLVVPVEEYMPYFRRLLSSVDEQTLWQMELIVVSSTRDCRVEQDIKLFGHKACTLIAAEPGTPMTDMIMQGARRAQGDYIAVCNECFFFESFAMEVFCKQMREQNLDILQFQVEILPENGVTRFQTGVFSSNYALVRERLAGIELLRKCYLEHKVSPRIEGKVFRRELFERALTAADEFGCSHREALWAYAGALCGAYQGGTSQKCANFVLRTKDVLSVDEAEFSLELSKRGMCDNIRDFLNSDYCADLPQEQRREIADAVHEESLKSVVVLWNSNRFPEEARAAAIERIAEEWGLRELLGSMAAWGTERMASNCRYLVQLFPCTTKTEYRQMAVWGADWAPFDDDVAGRWIRFCDAETVPADANAETVAALPKAEGRQWFCQRLDAIRQAIETYRIDAVFFKDRRIGNIWDMLAVLACGAHAIIDDREVPELHPIYRQNGTGAYMDHVLPMLFANAVMLSHDADTAHFDDLGIRYVREGDLRQTVEKALEAARMPMGADGAHYLEHLLREKYFQELQNASRELGRFHQIAGPYSAALSRGVNVRRIQSGIRNALWREKFIRSSVMGKCKLLVKTGLRMVGFRRFSLGLQNYYPQPRLTVGQKWEKLCARARLLLHPIAVLEKIRKKQTWSVAREKRLCLGKENPDKTFYLVRLKPGNEGLLLSYLRLLRELDRLDKTQLIPVIDMSWTYYVMAHNSSKEQGRVNGWERYFRPVAGYALKQVAHSQNVIRGQLCYREQVDNYFRNNILRWNTPEAEQEFLHWCRLDHKYMRLKDELLAQYEKECADILKGKRTIGVMSREGYSILNKLNYALIANHAVQPEIESVIDDVVRLMDEWNCEQVFVSAEYAQTISAFQKALGDKVVFTSRERKNFDAADADEYRIKRESYYKEVTREQINYDYLKEVYLLSQCTCLLASRASASIVAALWNGGKYEHRYIYDLGTYSVSNEKPVVTLEDKQ